LDLPGIDFLYSTKRYYPNGDFLSYTLGYVKKDDNNNAFGEMGVELYYDDELSGENGYIEYQSDIQGYQITNTPSVEKLAVPGNDVYLTIDNNIQMFTEQAITTLETSSLEWAMMVVANAKTGEILGLAASPSFNNNTLEIKSYYDPFVSYTYEPGSTMKIFSFLGAMENGIYDGNAKYKSGKLKVDDATIKDWNNYGWGEITYNQGFMGSSNVAASTLALKLGRAKLMDYYNSLGFGTKTGISLPNETAGVVNFKYNTEIASASFGQGVTISGIQMVQALTTLANKGVMLKPYIVSKVVNSETGEVIIENKRTEVRKVSSEETVNKMLELMRGVVEGGARMATGTGYYVEGLDLVGKTGTAEIASSSGGYLTGSYNRVRSFAGVFPGNDPQVIVYVAASKISNSSLIKDAVKSLVKDIGTYLNINQKTIENEQDTYITKSYINKDVKITVEALNNSGMKPIVIGDGSKIVKQYPNSNVEMNLNNKIFLITNADKYKMLDIIGWSRSDVQTYANLLSIDVNFTGYGYVKTYTIKKDTEIEKGMSLEVELQPKYN
jgi:penicillin-binding protein 2B